MAIEHKTDTSMIDPFLGFRFEVDLGGVKVACSDVTVPETSVENVEYRTGVDPNTKRMLSGLNGSGSITLKRGITKDMEALYKWCKDVQDKGIRGPELRKTVTITLLDEAKAPAAQWSFDNAWPIKYEIGDFAATSSDIVFETLEITHEGITRTL
jgi:phage tail-like protein